MDPVELHIAAKFAEVVPQVEGLVRSILLEESVPFSTKAPPTVSAGTLNVPRIQHDHNHRESVSRSRPRRENTGSVHNLKTGCYKRASHSIQGEGQQLKKQRALPYEKYEDLEQRALPYEKYEDLEQRALPYEKYEDLKQRALPYEKYEDLEQRALPYEKYKDLEQRSLPYEKYEDLEQNALPYKNYEDQDGLDVFRTKLSTLKTYESKKSVIAHSETSCIKTAGLQDTDYLQTSKTQRNETSPHTTSFNNVAQCSDIPPMKHSSPSPVSFSTGSSVTSRITSSVSSPVAASVTSQGSTDVPVNLSFTEKTKLGQPSSNFSSSPLSFGSSDNQPEVSGVDSSLDYKSTSLPPLGGPSKSKPPSDTLSTAYDGGPENKLKPVEIGTLDEKEILEMLDTLIKAQRLFDTFPSHSREDLSAKQENFLKFKERMQNSTGSGNESQDVRSKILDQVMKYYEKKILETVRFAKRIPGFLDLPRDDQANLIRESRTECDIVSGLRGINIQNKVFSSHEGHHFSIEDMKTVFPEEILDCFYEGAVKASNLHTTEPEEALLRAITITFPDRCELQCREKVEDIQNRLVSCLLYVVKRNGDPVGLRMGHLFNFLIFCRNLTEIHQKVTKNVLHESEKHNCNPIVQEVFL